MYDNKINSKKITHGFHILHWLHQNPGDIAAISEPHDCPPNGINELDPSEAEPWSVYRTPTPLLSHSVSSVSGASKSLISSSGFAYSGMVDSSLTLRHEYHSRLVIEERKY